ncbi:hypothetical protein QBC37DRAFT_475885 [Rhypophila decipiens]|uniref:Uncharacterized protein n=1 Tax=Rhypophila decipiens TaxID=261697 RepID=A0AAN6XY15_9PEZI|nr:hypothetical protein QBC37DRAFT_475885 [Rhypophila decipiens]
MGINQSSPSCEVNACLNQVIGHTNNNGFVQYQSCIAMFGSPAVTVTTAAPETIYSTATDTVSYTDVTVVMSTVVETVYQTSTSFAEVLETVTEYTATNVVTEATTVTVGATATPAKKKKKRGACHHGPTTSTFLSSTAAASSAPSSSVPVLDEYSSACSCIYAVSSTSTYTEVPLPSLAATTLTVSSAIPTTSVSVVTEYVTVTVPEAATTTRTSTISTALDTTTRSTMTLTTSPPPDATSSSLVIANGPRAGRYLTLVNGYLQFGANNAGVDVAVRLVIPPSGGAAQLALASDPSVKMVSLQTTSIAGVLGFESDAVAAAAGNPAVTCTNTDGNVACAIPGRGFTKVFNCGAYLYIVSPAWAQSSGCTAVTFNVSA